MEITYSCLFAIMCSIVGIHGNPTKCQQPSQDALRAQLNQYTPNAHSYAATAGTYSPPSSTACPLSYGSGAPLEIRSTCPYYHVENTDDDRYPQTLVEAECYDCRKCVTDLIEHSDYHPIWRCETITTGDLTVLEKTKDCDSEGFYVYEPTTVKLALACTCGRERV